MQSQILPCIWASSIYFLTFHPQHSQIPLKSKQQSFWSGVKKRIARARECSDVHIVQKHEYLEIT